jgi:hypothetical protein
MKNTKTPDFILLDSRRGFLEQLGLDRTFWVSTTGDLQDAFLQSSPNCLWISMREIWTDRLIKAALARSQATRQEKSVFGNLLMFTPPRSTLIPPLHSYFKTVVGEVPSFQMLPPEQLADVLARDDRKDLFIGGILDETSKTVTLVRGDLRPLVAPLSIFRPAGPCSPDFRHFELDDFGYTVRFGQYEASAHAVLFEMDPTYRRDFNQRRRATEKGFGPSLRRLRILRRLGRDDFPGIAAKTIARIERNEIGKPHDGTLRKISQVLGVAPEDIESY